MPSYSEGKIYKLISPHTEEVYIGSTIQLLQQRKSKHLHKFKKGILTCLSKKIFDAGDVDIVLLENYPCESKRELEERERYWIETTEKCINKMFPTRTSKEYYESNKEDKKQYGRDYYYKNRDKVLERCSEYREKNKDKIKAYMQKYYESHK